MLSPCSILTNNISVVSKLRHMLEKQVHNRHQHASSSSVAVAKLKNLREEAQCVRNTLQELKTLVSSPFEALIPQQYRHFLNKQPSVKESPVTAFDDKENIENNYQTRHYSSKSVSHCDSGKQSSRQECHALRNMIMKDLDDLKRMEQKERILREISRERVNRNVYTDPKRRPLEEIFGVSDTKSINHSESRNNTFVTEQSIDSKMTQSIITPIQDSNIVVPSLMKPTSKSLFCPNRHQYYSGDVLKGVPHHKGRLFYCCSSMPMKVPEGTQFYSGGFSKGRFEGYGTLTFKNGTKFVGTFRDGLRHGDGSIYHKGSVEMGKWQFGKLANKK